MMNPKVILLLLLNHSIFGQITLPTFQGSFASSSSSYSTLSECSGDNIPTTIPFNFCSSSNCGGAALCSPGSNCYDTGISMRWHSQSETRPDNLVLTKQNGTTVTLSAKTTGDRGWYDWTGGNDPNGRHIATNQNTYTGHYPGSTRYLRSWFSWNLCSVESETIIAAKIELDIETWYNTSGGTDAYSKIWEVSNTTHAEIITSKDNAQGLEMFKDIGDGLLYSCLTIVNNNLGLYTFQLSSEAVSKINALHGGYFIVGNSISCG